MIDKVMKRSGSVVFDLVLRDGTHFDWASASLRSLPGPAPISQLTSGFGYRLFKSINLLIEILLDFLLHSFQLINGHSLVDLMHHLMVVTIDPLFQHLHLVLQPIRYHLLLLLLMMVLITAILRPLLQSPYLMLVLLDPLRVSVDLSHTVQCLSLLRFQQFDFVIKSVNESALVLKQFLNGLETLVLLPLPHHETAEPLQLPLQVLYVLLFLETTHVPVCGSPFHRRQKLNREKVHYWQGMHVCTTMIVV